MPTIGRRHMRFGHAQGNTSRHTMYPLSADKIEMENAQKVPTISRQHKTMDIAGKRKRERRKYMKSYTVIANEKKEKDNSRFRA